MSTKALKKELLVAVVMLLVAAVALSGSTYAWFAVNNQVTVTGLEVKTQVAGNLFVANSSLAATGNADPADFGPALHKIQDGGILEPVSTIDALNFFYTNAKNNVNNQGQAITSSYIAYNTSKAAPTAAELSAFVANNTINNSVGYTDYVFELKAVNGKDQAVELTLSKLNLTYHGLPTAEKAWRAAVFMEKFNGTAYTAVSPETLPAASTILAPQAAAYFTTDNAVNSTNSVGAVSKLRTAVKVNVAANSTEYYKVVVRIWLEGEDDTCKNETFASLTEGWALDVKYELDTGVAGATVIGTPAINASGSGALGTVELTNGALSNGEMPKQNGAYQWYKADGTKVNGANESSFTVTAQNGGTGVYYCEVITMNGNHYFTPGITLTVAP